MKKLFRTAYLSLRGTGAPPVIRFIKYRGDTPEERKTAYRKALGAIETEFPRHEIQVSPPTEDFSEEVNVSPPPIGTKGEID